MYVVSNKTIINNEPERREKNNFSKLLESNMMDIPMQMAATELMTAQIQKVKQDALYDNDEKEATDLISMSSKVGGSQPDEKHIIDELDNQVD